MNKRSLLIAGLLAAAAVTNVYALPYGFYDARSVAMGNVSMATGGITTAALSNPGMLAINESNDTHALLLPAIGVQVIDDGNMIDLVDEFQDLDGSSNPADVLRQVAILNELDNASLIAAVIPNIAYVYSGDDFTWGITLRGNAVVSAGVRNVNTNPANPDADIVALGVGITEIGIPMGTKFSFAGMQMSVGITPRFVQVDAITYSQSISTGDLENITDGDTEDLGSYATLDVGIVVSVLDTLRVGLVVKDLVGNTFTTNSGDTIEFDTHYRLGAAFDIGFMTIAADYDLTERDPIGFENPSQSFSVGAEFDTFSVAQLRLGYQTNLADGATDPNLISAGVGFWLGFNLDIAVVVGDDSSFGGFVQTGFHF